MPRKGKAFTPQQKRVISYHWNRLESAIRNFEDGRYSFIKKKVGVGLDDIPATIRTNKGIFFNQPGAKVTKKKGKKPKLEIRFGFIKELYIPFPEYVQGFPERIFRFVDEQKKKQKPKPDSILLAINGNMGKRSFPSINFEGYLQNLFLDQTFSKDYRDAENAGRSFFTGVYFSWQQPVMVKRKIKKK